MSAPIDTISAMKETIAEYEQMVDKIILESDNQVVLAIVVVHLNNIKKIKEKHNV